MGVGPLVSTKQPSGLDTVPRIPPTPLAVLSAASFPLVHPQCVYMGVSTVEREGQQIKAPPTIAQVLIAGTAALTITLWVRFEWVAEVRDTSLSACLPSSPLLGCPVLPAPLRSPSPPPSPEFMCMFHESIACEGDASLIEGSAGAGGRAPGDGRPAAAHRVRHGRLPDQGRVQQHAVGHPDADRRRAGPRDWGANPGQRHTRERPPLQDSSWRHEHACASWQHLVPLFSLTTIRRVFARSSPPGCWSRWAPPATAGTAVPTTRRITTRTRIHPQQQALQWHWTDESLDREGNAMAATLGPGGLSVVLLGFSAMVRSSLCSAVVCVGGGVGGGGGEVSATHTRSSSCSCSTTPAPSSRRPNRWR